MKNIIILIEEQLNQIELTIKYRARFVNESDPFKTRQEYDDYSDITDDIFRAKIDLEKSIKELKRIENKIINFSNAQSKA